MKIKRIKIYLPTTTKWLSLFTPPDAQTNGAQAESVPIYPGIE